MNDFAKILKMLTESNQKFKIGTVEGEHPGIEIPSPFPKNYSTGVYISFHEDGSLFAIHAYEPDGADE